MTSEFRITPLHLALMLDRPEGPGCTACRRPWPAHPPESLPPAPCERCGAWFSYTCYLSCVATAAEARRFADPHDDMKGAMFLCPACRS